MSFDGILAAYVVLKKAFDSVYCEALRYLLCLRRILADISGLLTCLYSMTESAEGAAYPASFLCIQE